MLLRCYNYVLVSFFFIRNIFSVAMNCFSSPVFLLYFSSYYYRYCSLIIKRKMLLCVCLYKEDRRFRDDESVLLNIPGLPSTSSTDQSTEVPLTASSIIMCSLWILHLRITLANLHWSISYVFTEYKKVKVTTRSTVNMLYAYVTRLLTYLILTSHNVVHKLKIRILWILNILIIRTFLQILKFNF